MKVYQIVSRHGYDSAARNPRITHYSNEDGFEVVLSLMCGRTLVSGVHKIVPAPDQTKIATCKRCLERAAKKVMLNKEKPKPIYIDFETQVDNALANVFDNYHQGNTK